jgi:hypothetical protein
MFNGHFKPIFHRNFVWAKFNAHYQSNHKQFRYKNLIWCRWDHRLLIFHRRAYIFLFWKYQYPMSQSGGFGLPCSPSFLAIQCLVQHVPFNLYVITHTNLGRGIDKVQERLFILCSLEKSSGRWSVRINGVRINEARLYINHFSYHTQSFHVKSKLNQNWLKMYDTKLLRILCIPFPDTVYRSMHCV